MAAILFETPVAFPLIGEPRVFVVNDRDGIIYERRTPEPPSYYDRYDEVTAVGMSSASEIGGSNESILITTSPVADRVIAIALLKSGCEPVLIHLDLRSECSLLTESVVACKAFACCSGNAIQLVLVDAAAVILTIRLTADTLTPIVVPCNSGSLVSVRCLCTSALLPDTTTAVQAALIRSSMVAFVSSDVLLVSLNPYLLAVDLLREHVQPWSKSKCLEDMRARASGLRNWISRGAELLLGKWEAVIIDMNPVAAVCTADNDPSTIFTLHSDGIVRHWTLPVEASAILPISVHDLVVHHVPDPSTWNSDAVNSTYMTARMYENLSRVFVLVMHVQAVVQVADTSEGLDESRRAASKHVLIAVDGSMMEEGESVITHSIRLAAPAQATALVDMQLDPHSDRCQMRALFRTDTSETATGAVFCIYGPSTLSILSREPSLSDPNYFLDGVAMQERERIQQLSFIGQVYRLEADTLEDVLFEIDRRFLQYLFRPTFPRGNGTVLPPCAKHIRRAMQKLMSSNNTDVAFGGSTANMNVEVVRFILEWRKREHYRIISMTPLKKTQRSLLATPGSTLAYAGESLYDALEDDEESEVSVEMDIHEADESTLDKRKEVKDHERRWRQLLIQICVEEEIERAPVAMSIAANTVDAAVIVRPGCICAVTSNEEVNHQSLSVLDRVSMKLLEVAAHDEGISSCLAEAEQFIWESISRGQLALKREDAQNFKEMIGCIDLPSLNDIGESKLVRDLTTEEQGFSLLLEAPLHCSLSGLCLLTQAGHTRPEHVAPQSPVMSIQSRLAAGSLVVRGADSFRRLSLARHLALSEIGSVAADTALRMYLHAIAVMDVAARTVPFPTISSLEVSLQQLQFDQSVGVPSPPKKRSRVSSVLEAHGTLDRTIALDSLLIQLSQRLLLSAHTEGSLAAIPATLGRAAMMSSFQFGASVSDAITLQQLPELGILSMPSGEIAQPELAIRLLAVHIAMPRLDESEEVAMCRKELIAKCLVLLSRSKFPNEAVNMMTRAFDLLPFNEKHIEKSMGHLTTLETRIGENNSVGGNMLVEYVDNALGRVQAAGFPVSDANYESLWSTLFNTAISIRNWAEAYRACLNQPNAKNRISKFKRLVRAMIEAGALSDLLERISSLNDDADAIQNDIDFYEIAVDSLSEMVMRDLYTSLAIDPEPPSDYQGALYVLHVSQKHWKKAAQTMDLRFIKARDSLSTHVLELSLEQQERRERLIVDDMVLAAVGCYYAMKMVTEPNAKYLLSGGRGFQPSVLIHRRGDNSGIKHNREGDSRSHIIETADNYMNICDLEARAIKYNVLKALFYDRLADPSFAMSALLNEDDASEIPDFKIVDQLFARGFYPDGLSLANIMNKVRGSKPNGRSFFRDALSHLICGYLLPLVLEKKYTPEKQTIPLLQTGIDSLKQPHQLVPTLLVGGRAKKLSLLERSQIRMLAMFYARELTEKHTSCEQPLAVEVARAMLSDNRSAAPLPLWLEDLLLTGTVKSDLPGLFARRRTPALEGYLGDPSVLLNLYTMRGLYADACRVVKTVLAGPGNNYRESAAPSRLPEKGEMDFVPYKSIDFLWNLIDITLQNKVLEQDECVKLDQARSEMKRSLKKHFELLKISEMGRQSARTLSQP